MMNSFSKLLVTGLLAGFMLTGCEVQSIPEPTVTPTLLPQTNTSIPPTPSPTITPTPTEIPFFVDAIVWTGEPQVPILIYHRFVPDIEENTPTTKIRFSDFKRQLQQLYDNGFSLIPLTSWLDGTFVVPEGRRPLILTIDDFWSADQVFIDEDGTPSQYSGIGILWRFSQEHPDFGFSVSGFSNMGDKFFADTLLTSEQRFIRNSEDKSNIWRDKLSAAMVWSIENGVEPYNHTYTHVQLDKTSPQDIQYQLADNDRVTRYFLTRVNREDLIPRLGNIIALPFGIWPATYSGVQVLKNYKNPEGLPVAAILEAYNLDEAQLTPSVFSNSFDRYKIQRITSSDSMIQFIIDHKEEIPTAQFCKVGPIDEAKATDVDELKTGIIASITAGACPEGIYNINGEVFIAKDGVVNPFTLNVSQ
jgi:hypothetical protein